jgi:hypothetical protein
MSKFFLCLVLVITVVGCGSESDQAAISPTTTLPAATKNLADSTQPTQSGSGESFLAMVTAEAMVASDWTSAWILNTTGETSPVFAGVAVDVTAVYINTDAGVDYQCIQSSGIPSYATRIDQNTIDHLTGRPHAHTDFGTGVPAIADGDMVNFGEDIGYDPLRGCTDVGDGYGYWPPGPGCPSNQNKDWCFPLDPEPIAEGETCATGLNQIGVWVNGVSIFNWQDGQSYNNENVWVNDAVHFEMYDLDICAGHAANGNYHHHSSPTCLGKQLGDDGSDTSPIYGFAADGYPILGPWAVAGTLAQSCWQTRDYDDPASSTGCGVSGERSCLLVDPYDMAQGIIAAPSKGPSTGDIITSMSGNPITAVSGAYFQDYYYDADCTAQGPEYLDEHNGHETAALGYHYHTTLVETETGELDYAFPHYAGPTYAGVLMDNAIARCSTDNGGPPPGQGNASQGYAPQGNAPQNGGPDLAAAATTLGITEAELREALGPPPPDFAAAAEALGISVEALQNALGGRRP